MALGGRLAAVDLFRLGYIAVAVDDCGAFGKCDGLARLALGEIGLHIDSISMSLA